MAGARAARRETRRTPSGHRLQPYPSLAQFADTTIIVERPRASISSDAGGGAGAGDGGERHPATGGDLDPDRDFEFNLDSLDDIIDFET